MWYFAWILGLGLAVTLAILNGLWHEFHSDLSPSLVKPKRAVPSGHDSRISSQP